MASETVQKPPVRRWVRILLVVSLSLNLLVVGIVVGALANGPRLKGGSGPDLVLPYTRALTDEDRKTTRQKFRRAAFADKDARGALLNHYQEALQTLRRDPFEPEALAQILQTQSQAAQQRMSQGQAVLVDVIAGMSVSERAAYADRLEEQLERFKKRGPSWGPRDGDKADR